MCIHNFTIAVCLSLLWLPTTTPTIDGIESDNVNNNILLMRPHSGMGNFHWHICCAALCLYSYVICILYTIAALIFFSFASNQKFHYCLSHENQLICPI